METKIIRSKKYLALEGKTTFNELIPYAGKKVEQVYTGFVKGGFDRVGPVEFLYFGASVEKNKEFTLQIALPVKEIKPVSEHFKLVEVSEFKCLSYLLKGGMSGMETAYEKMYEYIWDNSLKLTNEIRQIYHVFKHPESDQNITEIQIGIL